MMRRVAHCQVRRILRETRLRRSPVHHRRVTSFALLADRIVETILDDDPASCYIVGDHRLDDRLVDLSPEGVARETAMLRAAAGELRAAEPVEVDEQVDHAILSATVEHWLFELTELRVHEWNPLLHNPGVLIAGLVERDSAPAAERLGSLLGRLGQLPDALAASRRMLHDCPEIHVRAAIAQFGGLRTLVADGVARLLAELPGRPVGNVPDAALAAIDEFVGWLEGLGPGRSPRLGRALWERKMALSLDTDLPAADIVATAWTAVERITDELDELCGGDIPAAFAELAADPVRHDQVLAHARRITADARAFVAAHDLVTMVDDPVEIVLMPAHRAGVSTAKCHPPGPFDPAHIPTLIQLGVSSDPAASVDNTVAALQDMLVHEAMPGHYLQLAHGRRHRGKVRALCASSAFREGWAVHAERLMADAGFGGRGMKLAQLKTQLRVALNAILDQLVHCADAAENEVVALLTERGFQSVREVRGKWRRAQLTSVNLSTYHVGYTEVAAIAAARPAGTTVREWHDRMLAHGSPPARHLRTLLGQADA